MNSVVQYLKKNRLTMAGTAIGIAGGLLHWRFVGCATGSCPITSSPWLSALWGAVIGGLLFSLFTRDRLTENNTDK